MAISLWLVRCIRGCHGPLTHTHSEFAQYADLGYAETDKSIEWDNDYPNAITYFPPDKLTTDPGIITVQFDNVLNAVRAVA